MDVEPLHDLCEDATHGEDREFLGLTPISIGGATLWHGRGPYDDPYYKAFLWVDAPAWYPLVTYTVFESRDGDGWVVTCRHNSCLRPVSITDHPLLDAQPLPETLAAVILFVREKINAFCLLDRAWRSGQTLDLEELANLRDDLAPTVAEALSRIVEPPS